MQGHFLFLSFFLFFKYFFLHLGCAGSQLWRACGIQFPLQGSNPGPLHWECGVLPTGPPGKCMDIFKRRQKSGEHYNEAPGTHRLASSMINAPPILFPLCLDPLPAPGYFAENPRRYISPVKFQCVSLKDTVLNIITLPSSGLPKQE